LNSAVRLNGELAVGRQNLTTIFSKSPSHSLKAGEILAAATGSSNGIHHLRAGWACQFRELPDGRRAIIDVYLPGDVIGLDAILRTRPPEQVRTLTSAAVQTIHAGDGLIQLMACPSTALYVVRLLAERQRRADRFLTAVSCLDARGRLAMMMLDFYTRLRRKKLITGSSYNSPLSQVQIGSYLGLTVVHVSRVLGALRDERVVHLEKHCVTILDLDRLTRLAQNRTASSGTSIGERVLNEAAD
jgi:CRP-like cAMP-binding protein